MQGETLLKTGTGLRSVRCGRIWRNLETMPGVIVELASAEVVAALTLAVRQS
jgi:hypothetical protein